MDRIYLDHNATTPLHPAAWTAMQPLLSASLGNPASVHFAGRHARRQLEDAREQVAHFLDARPDEVIFTSGATEANNLALFGLAGSDGHLLASPIEHPCVVGPLQQLAQRGHALTWLPVNSAGQVAPTDLANHLRPDTRLISIIAANHETGTLQPLADLVTAALGIPVHTDAAQAVGKIPVRFRAWGLTALTASGHKFGGPVGMGVLLLRHGTPLQPQLFGGHQQQARRPGTESVALAVGFAAALAAQLHDHETHLAHVRQLRATFLAALAPAQPLVNSPPDGLPHTLNVSFPGCRADLLVLKIDLAGVACSTGAACASGSQLASPVLQALHLPPDRLTSALRFSFAPTQTVAEVTTAAQRIVIAVTAWRSNRNS
jgi:cysteine desulfurase